MPQAGRGRERGPGALSQACAKISNVSDQVQSVVAVVAVIGVLVATGIAFVRGRQIARLERSVGALLGTTEPLGDARAKRLGAPRSRTHGRSPRPDSRAASRRAAGVAVLVVMLVILGAAAWYVVAHRSGSATPRTSARTGLGPDPQTVVPARPPALAHKGSYTVAVLNGANPNLPLASQAQAAVSAAGYSAGLVGNASVAGLAHSVVMWAPGQQVLALNVAHDLGIPTVAPLDGFSQQDIGGADALVLVGLDRVRH